MKTLKDFKAEELDAWRAIPITRAVIDCLRSLQSDAEQEALVLLRGTFLNDAAARVMSGVAEGVSKAAFFIERGGK